MPLVNVLLPYARSFHAYAALSVAGCALAAFTGYGVLGRKLRETDEARLVRLRNAAVPVYAAVLFALQVLMGYLLEYVPAGDNFMLYIALFGVMLFLMLWEPRSCYLFGYVPLFLIAAAISAADMQQGQS